MFVDRLKWECLKDNRPEACRTFVSSMLLAGGSNGCWAGQLMTQCGRGDLTLAQAGGREGNTMIAGIGGRLLSSSGA
jgi:hypothetical protein